MKASCLTLIIISICLSCLTQTSVLNAQTEIELSTEGVVFPRMDTETRDGLTAIQGQCIYNTESGTIDCFDGTRWSSTLTDQTSSSNFNRKDFEVLRPDDQASSGIYGYSLDMYGSDIIVGDPFENDNGAVYIYHYNGIEWERQERLIEENGQSDFQFGYSVSIHDQYAVVGSILTLVEGEEVGVVYVYKKENQDWSISDTLIAFDGEDGDRFGESVMIHDDFLIIGAPEAKSQTPSSGRAYIYQLQNDEWLLDTVFAPQVAMQSSFGRHVAITDKYAIISVPNDKSVPGAKGSAFIYKRGNSEWEFEQVVRGRGGFLGREFGSAIAIDGEDLIVGAHVGLVIRADSSQVYYFQKNLATDIWEEKQVIKNPEGPHIKDLGRFLSVSQNTLTILTYDGTDPTIRIGQARSYNKTGANWTLSSVLTPFGVDGSFESVLLYEDWLLLGSRDFSTDGILKGGVFIF